MLEEKYIFVYDEIIILVLFFKKMKIVLRILGIYFSYIYLAYFIFVNFFFCIICICKAFIFKKESKAGRFDVIF